MAPGQDRGGGRPERRQNA